MNPLASLLAQEGARMLFRALPQVVARPSDLPDDNSATSAAPRGSSPHDREGRRDPSARGRQHPPLLQHPDPVHERLLGVADLAEPGLLDLHRADQRRRRRAGGPVGQAEVGVVVGLAEQLG